MIKVAPREPLTREDYFKLHGEPQGETRLLLLSNADLVIARRNALVAKAWAHGVDTGIDQVSGNPCASGYRPAGANAATANAASASKHLTCEAEDEQDLDNRAFAVWCCWNVVLLIQFDLWMEDPRWTGGRTNTDPWVHLQIKPPHSGKRIYIPSSEPPTDPTFFERNGLVAP